MHELHVLVYCADSRYTEGDYARIDGGKACDGVKAVESTRRAEDGMGNWHGQERMVVGTYGSGRLGLDWRICEIEGRASLSLPPVTFVGRDKATSMPRIPWETARICKLERKTCVLGYWHHAAI
jgi:hypothetical protein